MIYFISVSMQPHLLTFYRLRLAPLFALLWYSHNRKDTSFIDIITTSAAHSFSPSSIPSYSSIFAIFVRYTLPGLDSCSQNSKLKEAVRRSRLMRCYGTQLCPRSLTLVFSNAWWFWKIASDTPNSILICLLYAYIFCCLIWFLLFDASMYV